MQPMINLCMGLSQGIWVFKISLLFSLIFSMGLQIYLQTKEFSNGFALPIVQWTLGLGNVLLLFQFHSCLEVTELIPTMTIIHTKHHEIWWARSRHSLFLKQDYSISPCPFLVLYLYISPLAPSQIHDLFFFVITVHVHMCTHTHTNTHTHRVGAWLNLLSLFAFPVLCGYFRTEPLVLDCLCSSMVKSISPTVSIP